MKIVSLTFFKEGPEGEADYFKGPQFDFVFLKSFEKYRLLSANKPEGFGGFFGVFLVIGEGLMYFCMVSNKCPIDFYFDLF